jgi:hypothetical protein
MSQGKETTARLANARVGSFDTDAFGGLLKMKLVDYSVT